MDMYANEDEIVHETSRNPAEQQPGGDDEVAEERPEGGHDVPTEAARRGESEGAPHEGEQGQDIM